jgi:GTPase
MITETFYNEEKKELEYKKTTAKKWAQDVLMDIISQYNYRLEDNAAYQQDRMTEKELQQCMDQLKKQADRVAKMFGYDQHWIT